MQCIINSRKFDSSVQRSWECSLVEKSGPLMLFEGVFDRDVAHEHLGIIRRGTISYEYYWLDRWYNVFRFHEPDGRLRNYYCNINMPPTYAAGVLDYIDLDIDIVVWNDFSYFVLDEDEFKENAVQMNYPEDVMLTARKAIVDIKELIEKREFPFDHEMQPKFV